MENLYWLGEYVKVLLGAFALMFVWPSIVFYPILHKQTLTFRFSFCLTVQAVLVSSAVLFMGVFHILSMWVFNTLFYGVFIIRFIQYLLYDTSVFDVIHDLSQKTLGWKQLIYKLVRDARGRVSHTTQAESGVWLRRALLLAVAIYGMVYFSYGAVLNPTYAFSDMNVHHSWFSRLLEGEAFSHGVYPEGMHCLAYAIHSLFNINSYSCLLFLGSISTFALIISAYIFFKAIFRSPYMPILAVTLFVILDVQSPNAVVSMSRLQCSLPQDVGLHMEFLITAHLIEYIKRHFKERKLAWDGDLFLFSMALAASIAYHFYVTMMAFFLCVAVVVVMPRRIFCWSHFLPLVVAAVFGVAVAAAPMVTAFVRGTPLQYSLTWALNIMSITPDVEGDEAAEEPNALVADGEINMNDQLEQQAFGSVDDLPAVPQGMNAIEMAEATPSELLEAGLMMDNTPEKLSIFGRMMNIWQSVMTHFNAITSGAVYYGYRSMHLPQRANWILWLTGFAVYGCVAWRLLYAAMRLLKKKLTVLTKLADKLDYDLFTGYAILAVASVIVVLAYAAPDVIPSLIEAQRLCSTEQMLICGLPIVIVDLVLCLIGLLRTGKLMITPLSLMVWISLFVGVVVSGHYHGYLAIALTQYNGASNVLFRIIESMPRETYTVVSPTDELYKVTEYGFHEEIQQLIGVQSISSIDSYYLPTQYIFVFMEKKAMLYAQYHIVGGPAWLADQRRYAKVFGEQYCSTGSEYLQQEVLDEYADDVIPPGTAPWGQYTSLEYRSIWEARLNRWIQRFQEVYPDSIRVYYEDDNFICYCITQNPQCSYNMVLR